MGCGCWGGWSEALLPGSASSEQTDGKLAECARPGAHGVPSMCAPSFCRAATTSAALDPPATTARSGPSTRLGVLGMDPRSP